jgi:hypothetical protein
MAVGNNRENGLQKIKRLIEVAVPCRNFQRKIPAAEAAGGHSRRGLFVVHVVGPFSPVIERNVSMRLQSPRMVVARYLRPPPFSLVAGKLKLRHYLQYARKQGCSAATSLVRLEEYGV